ncbi:MAG: hypothetical protein K0S47_1163 [Herbinix sp.]|jgi:phosphoglycerol transferase MdoB-like AlkP superfamily enzyme|nr:hypothetical protein [Herbinix sp.]
MGEQQKKGDMDHKVDDQKEEPKDKKKEVYLKIEIPSWKEIKSNMEHRIKDKIIPTIKKIPQSDIFYLLLFFPGMLIYLEMIFHLLNYRSLDGKIILPILFAIPVGIILTILCTLFERRVNLAILWVLVSIICLLFSMERVYFYVFKVYFSFQSVGMAGDAISEFNNDILLAIKENFFGLLLLFIPLPVLGLLLYNGAEVEQRKLRQQGLLLYTAVIFQILALGVLLLYGRGDYSPFDLYHNTKVPELCGKQLGLTTMVRFDVAKAIRGEKELVLANTPTAKWDEGTDPVISESPKPQQEAPVTIIPSKPNSTPTPSPLPTPTPIDTSPNVMDIDFAKLAEGESNDTIRTLHEYFASVQPTNKNEYTGMFEGYNLIMITAEGFSPYAVDKNVTPTLYKLTHEGFVFTNFYTALWQTSTSDGEYVACTGLIPVGTRSMYNSRNNLLPFCLGNQFNLLGVKSKAYHNHTYTYYQRNETHPNMGYQFIANGNGMELEHPDVWPESDLEMMETTIDDYIKEDQFHVYYLTVSGHMNYTFSGNSMAYKNRGLVEDLPYSSDAKAYIACQAELDRALKLLLEKLEEYGVADKTVIALSADHYPYGWEKKNIDEIAGRVVDPNFEIYRNHFILWNAAMKDNIIVDKPCSSMDILPTLSNLFGITYDSRLLMGQDIFSDSDPLVVLSNRSFITDKVMYNSETGKITKLIDGDLPDNYIVTLNAIVKNKFKVSQSILEQDYYREVFPNYPK